MRRILYRYIHPSRKPILPTNERSALVCESGGSLLYPTQIAPPPSSSVRPTSASEYRQKALPYHKPHARHPLAIQPSLPRLPGTLPTHDYPPSPQSTRLRIAKPNKPNHPRALVRFIQPFQKLKSVIRLSVSAHHRPSDTSMLYTIISMDGWEEIRRCGERWVAWQELGGARLACLGLLVRQTLLIPGTSRSASLKRIRTRPDLSLGGGGKRRACLLSCGAGYRDVLAGYVRVALRFNTTRQWATGWG